MGKWGNAIVPVIVAAILLISTLKKGKPLTWFGEGAQEGFRSLFSIAPMLIGMYVAIGVFKASGIMEWLSQLLAPALRVLHIPAELTTFILLRPLSGSGALAVLGDIYNQYGADSTVGRMASLMMGSTETIFYTLCVYMGAAGLKKGGYAIPAAVVAAAAGVAAAVAAVTMGL